MLATVYDACRENHCKAIIIKMSYFFVYVMNILRWDFFIVNLVFELQAVHFFTSIRLSREMKDHQSINKVLKNVAIIGAICLISAIVHEHKDKRRFQPVSIQVHWEFTVLSTGKLRCCHCIFRKISPTLYWMKLLQTMHTMQANVIMEATHQSDNLFGTTSPTVRFIFICESFLLWLSPLSIQSTGSNLGRNRGVLRVIHDRGSILIQCI